ncbi:hypothetical protein [Chromobacterium amazonense]|uniref:hypothetical protein n=1 Tax=Chromobacterium amazonense TaxID=1382803 RepID=UPI0021B7C288|nr:hypothetical protein [Chromobacterium amazonense]MBM2882832.1 hypothetical protein [Chromobacterium amazonense]MDE1714497.1 hypothetical protein [Chromobacterium amazonense]
MTTAQVKDAPVAFLSQPSDVLLLSSVERDRLIVTMRKIDGVFMALSVYGDDVWWLAGTTTSMAKSRTKIDFNSVPLPLRDVTKAMMYRYLRRGIRNARRPGASTVSTVFVDIGYFWSFVNNLGITRLCDITPMVCSAYVQFARSKLRGIGGTARSTDPANCTLSNGKLYKRFAAVEKVFELSQYTHDPMGQHPWIDSTADILSGGGGSPTRGLTPLIPDKVFAALFQRAHEIVQDAPRLLDLRDELNMFELRTGVDPRYFAQLKTKALRASGLPGYREFKKQLRQVRTACYVVVASLSGCRYHELANAKLGCCYSTEVDGERFWWLRSESSKTFEGKAEWMIPDAAVEALLVLERWSAPYREHLDQEIQSYRENDPADLRIAEAMDHVGSLFVGVDLKKSNLVRTISVQHMNEDLKDFAEASALGWPLATHQFRRKFANYVARSKFGDLRYLREHFKHWSVDMTIGYALNESQEMALYLEIQDELDDIKAATVSSWLDEREPLAGGYGQSLVDWRTRNDTITIFKSKVAMVQSIAQSTPIRSNGHAWCTASDNFCVGNDLERTRCGDGCDNAVIGSKHRRIYQGLYEHLVELQNSDEIGPGGRARVARDVRRCVKVLRHLGHDVEDEHGLT